MSAALSRTTVATAAMLGAAAYIGLSSAPGIAQGVKPIQIPITGSEDLQPQQALAQFYCSTAPSTPAISR